MIEIFNKIDLDRSNITCHSGGAKGSDTEWENACIEAGIKVNAYTYKTKYHKSSNKVEISDIDYNDGCEEILKANKFLKRQGISKYMHLLARNWAQVKYSDQIFAIGTILESGEKSAKGHTNRSDMQLVDGGTGYAIMMGIINYKEVFVFDQDKSMWFSWSHIQNKFIEYKQTPMITSENFAGIGTRELRANGLEAIKAVIKLLK